MIGRSDRWQKRVERGIRRQRKSRSFTCTICEKDVPFAWTCPCGFMICADCFQENAWGLTCNNVTWECPDCGGFRSF